MLPGELERPATVHARAILAHLRHRSLGDRATAEAAAELAALIWDAAMANQTAAERSDATLLGRLMDDPRGQAFSNLLADRAYRSRDPERVVSVVLHLLDALGTPRYLSVSERLALGGVRAVGPALPAIVARATLARLRDRTRSVILGASEPGLTEHLARRRAEGVRLNLNWLGEAVLGEEEAERRLDQYLELLRRPDVEAISVKASTLTSQLRLVAFGATLQRLRPRLRALYRAALAHPYRRADGSSVPKLVNLDMEAYRDLHLTVALFQSVLDEPEFGELKAGLALQAYLPDSVDVQRLLTNWAVRRVAAGKEPIRIRIVKGANLAAEQVEASHRGWQLPIYGSKAEVDANAKRMIDYAIRRPHLVGVELGVASHNVFDIAYALVLSVTRGVEHGVSFELLEGMADPLRRALRAIAGDVLVYGPVVEDRAMQSAIAYLIRRLDENTSSENFLRHAFAMTVDDATWQDQRRRFLTACAERHQLSTVPRRQPDERRVPEANPNGPFCNEPDTDFTQAHHREHILGILSAGYAAAPFEVPFQVDGVHCCDGPLLEGFDPSRPRAVPYRYSLARAEHLETALACAVRASSPWAQRSPDERAAILRKIAQRLRERRGQLIVAMVLDAGKRIEEADAEVSEAIDFAEYYCRSYLDLVGDPSLILEPKGVVLVASPWNFPLAIPAGGTLAALVTGNTVVLKPACETPWVARLLAEACWDAGVPLEALQLVFASDELASRLVTDSRVNAVILTGSTATAQLFYELRPDIDLMAETGGKNALIVSAMADRDLAIAHTVMSAFGHAGQKCSATSLLVCVPEVYDDPAFREALRDAAHSLPVGSAWDADSVVTPLIHPPRGALASAMESLAEGEEWLLRPHPSQHNPRLWHPGIKLLTQEGGPGHTTELFGPLLGVMRAESLDDALRIANATPYGLTAGLHSLDERDQRTFIERMRAGNLYVNRGTTGAIVGRQPFGGYKASCFGPGAKAGGPNYLAQLVRFREHGARPAANDSTLLPPVAKLCGRLDPILPEHSAARIKQAARQYAAALEHHYGLDHEPAELCGQVNVFSYRELTGLIVRVTSDADPVATACVCAAALTCMDRFELSASPTAAARLPWLCEVPGVHVGVESAHELAARLEAVGGGPPGRPRAVERVRVVGTPEPEAVAAAGLVGVHLATEPPLLGGRWELRHYVREQSVSVDTHRYGNLSAGALAPIGGRLRPPAPVKEPDEPRSAEGA